MKKLALALCLLAVSFTAQAQFEKGTTIINPSLSGLDFSYSKNDKAKFGVGAQVGTFFAEGHLRLLLTHINLTICAERRGQMMRSIIL